MVKAENPTLMQRFYERPLRQIAAFAGALSFVVTLGYDGGHALDNYYEADVIHHCPPSWPMADIKAGTGASTNFQYDLLDFKAMLLWNALPAPGLAGAAVEAGSMTSIQLQAAKLILRSIEVSNPSVATDPDTSATNQTAYLISGPTNLSRLNETFCSTGILGTGNIYFTPAAVEAEADMVKAGIQVSALPDLNAQAPNVQTPTILAVTSRSPAALQA